MEKKSFQSLIKYYLSCIDAEEASSLQIRKNQENKSYIFLDTGTETLLSDDLPELEFNLNSDKQKSFIERKSPNKEIAISLYYGFPVFIDKKDMLSPLFFIEVEAELKDKNKVLLLPKLKSFTVNRMHFINNFETEEIQKICDELEGEFGSFTARRELAASYIPSLGNKGTNLWLDKPILFRTNYSGSKSGLRYDLTQLSKTDNAHTKDTALKYFTQSSNKENYLDKGQSTILEICPLNDQQEEAVLKGLKDPFSVVTGPPGTGKTQVVTTLLASAVYNNETVLFASNNNMPVDGVYERLGKNTGDFGNWLMRLGNKDKREACYNIISDLLSNIGEDDSSDMVLEIEKDKLLEADQDIKKARASLKKAKDLQEEISKMLNEEKALQQKIPISLVNQFNNTDPKPLNQEYLKKICKHINPGVLFWLRKKLFGLKKFSDRHNYYLSGLCGGERLLSIYKDWLISDDSWEESLIKAKKSVDYLIYYQKWAMCVIKRRELEKKILQYSSNLDINSLKSYKSKLSQKIFENFWISNIGGYIEEAIDALKSYFKDIDNFSVGRYKRMEKSLSCLKRFFPIWITTNQSLGTIIPLQPALFDLVIIDEAGQCDIPSVIPLLYRAKRAVIIGDPHQFKHITSIKDKMSNSIAKKLGIDDIIEDWSFINRSAFDRSDDSTNSKSLLKQHYRCHPDIVGFSNINFYKNELVEQVALSKFKDQTSIKEHGVIWHNTIGYVSKDKTGSWNPVEIEKTAEIFSKWSKQGLLSCSEMTYGIVTPFKKQATKMKHALSKYPWFSSIENRFTIGTAHSFQGSECDILIYSPVVSDGMADYLVDFASTQEDLINVSVTRAKNLLYIVGDLHACQSIDSDYPLYKLASYAESLRKQKKYPLNDAEKAMAAILDEMKLSYKFQYEIGEYRLDFLLNSSSGQRYDIEVDGDIHLTAEAIQHDERRDAYVKNKGLKIIRFSARDVINKPNLIKERLERI